MADIKSGLRKLKPLRSRILLALVALFAWIPSPATAQTVAVTRPESAQPSQATPQPQAAPLPQPAAVTLKNGTLTIQANNSDLGQILREVSSESGMVIDGQVPDARIYGSYGPRNPDEVLTELLADYNVIMVGTSRDGSPRQLQVTRMNARQSPPTPTKPYHKTTQQPEEPRLGPGAIAHPPPAQADEPETRRQQNMQRLQQMHDAQEKQNAPK